MSAPRARGVRRPGLLVGGLGLVLLVLSCVVATDLVRTSGEMQRTVTRSEGLLTSHVRALGQTQRELLRLLHLLDVRASESRVRQQATRVGRRTRASAASYAEAGPDVAGLAATTRRNHAFWRTEVRPDLDGALRGGPGSARATRRATARIQELERSYDVLAAVGENDRREQVATTTATATRMSDDLRGLLLMLGVVLLAAVASSATGAVLFLRAERRRRRADRELRALNDDLTFYSRVVQATDNALVATDRQGRITWVNDAFERTSGWRLDQVRGRHPGELVCASATDPETLRRLDEAVAAGLPVRVEVANRTASGELCWVAVDLAPLHGPTGEPEGFFAVQTDITERHQAEQLLVEARRAAEESVRQKAAFLATMSHEIRTPLNAVLGLTDLLLLTELDAEQRDYVETAHRSGNHLLALVNDVLDYSALESGRHEYAEDPFSPWDLLGETVGMLGAQAEAKQVALRLRVGADVPESLCGDEVRLRQVLVNLVGNALKFTEQGAVTVECSVARRGEDPAGRPLCELVTTVADTGIGIPAWRIPDLFQSFVRGDASAPREYGGTGLGLAISRGLVQAMGGSIELDSELGQGTTVTIRTVHPLAGADGAPAPGTVLPGPQPVAADRLSVLVAEDDAVNRKVIVGMLGRLGIVPTVVGNGREAVDLVAQGSFEVVLMDVEMPVMDGVSAVRRIRDTPGVHAPYVIALTANALTGDRERFLEAGMDDYLSKPVTLGSLTAALARVDARRSAA